MRIGRRHSIGQIGKTRGACSESDPGLFCAIRGGNTFTHDSNPLRPARIGIADKQGPDERSSSKWAERDTKCARRVRSKAASARVRFAEVGLCATPYDACDGQCRRTDILENDGLRRAAVTDRRFREGQCLGQNYHGRSSPADRHFLLREVAFV
jgi:hypothetical protein